MLKDKLNRISKLNEKPVLISIFDIQSLISFFQEFSYFWKYLIFILFVISPMYNIFKTYKEKKYNNFLEFIYKLYDNHSIYYIEPFGTPIRIIINTIRKINLLFKK